MALNININKTYHYDSIYKYLLKLPSQLDFRFFGGKISSLSNFNLENASNALNDKSIWTQTKEYLNIQKLILSKEARAVNIELSFID